MIKLATSDTWNVSKIKNTLEHLSGSLEQWFEIEFQIFLLGISVNMFKLTFTTLGVSVSS
jgi:hypothetical protein